MTNRIPSAIGGVQTQLCGTSVPGPFHYQLFGLRIRSEIELPELGAVERDQSADVEIRIGPPAAAGGANIAIKIEGVGSYWVSGGSCISLQPEVDVPDSNVRLYLLGSAMGALLHQRAILPLHANAIACGDRAFAIMGATGAGKSTLAASFHDHGFHVMTDDVCAISFDGDGKPRVRPGIARLRMWRDALLASGRSPGDFERSFAGDEDYEKYDVPIETMGDEPARLEAVYVLSDGDDVGIVPIIGVEAAEAIFANTYRGHLVTTTGTAEQHWGSAVRLIQSTPIFRLVRPRDLRRLGDVRRAIIDHFNSLG